MRARNKFSRVQTNAFSAKLECYASLNNNVWQMPFADEITASVQERKEKGSKKAVESNQYRRSFRNS